MNAHRFPATAKLVQKLVLLPYPKCFPHTYWTPAAVFKQSWCLLLLFLDWPFARYWILPLTLWFGYSCTILIKTFMSLQMQGKEIICYPCVKVRGELRNMLWKAGGMSLPLKAVYRQERNVNTLKELACHDEPATLGTFMRLDNLPHEQSTRSMPQRISVSALSQRTWAVMHHDHTTPVTEQWCNATESMEVNQAHLNPDERENWQKYPICFLSQFAKQCAPQRVHN